MTSVAVDDSASVPSVAVSASVLGGDASLSSLPLCMVVLDPLTLQPLAANALFERNMGELYKFSSSDFVMAACDGHEGKEGEENGNRERLREGIEDVLSGKVERGRVRNVEMITLGGESGFPVRRYFDWFISRREEGGGVESDGCDNYTTCSTISSATSIHTTSIPENARRSLILLGDSITNLDEEQREKDAELIDFFQNAPIALHWLSGEGKVLWANQTEMNVLGYTPEEYIGQPIMNFCPDEEELVLEIFKQLGSGNAIRDVPVRFRTKDGKIVHLLVDSNVRYNRDGSFGHTRCFIRDDTGRKVREARNKLWAEESKRTLDSLDHFMTRTLHHLRTPLHVTQSMVDSLSAYLAGPNGNSAGGMSFTAKERAECIELVRMTNDQISSSVKLLDDSRDLAKFDQGHVLDVARKVFDIEQFGNELLSEEVAPLLKSPKVMAVLELGVPNKRGGSTTYRADAGNEEGPATAVTDPKVLKRALVHLLANAADVTESGSVTLGIGYKNGGRITFVVSDTGPGFDMPDVPTLPAIFQKYTTEVMPTEDDMTHDSSTSNHELIRSRIIKDITSHKKNGLGIGLSLAYHLVQALGGELRCTSASGDGARFEFSLPRTVTHNAATSQPGAPKLMSTRISRKARAAKTMKEEISNLMNGGGGGNKKRSADDETIVSELTLHTKPKAVKKTRVAIARAIDIPATFEMPTDRLPSVPSATLAEKGLNCQDPPSVLVVEDTKACAKMMCMILNKFGCSTKWAENGQIAVDILREATPGMFNLVLMDLRMPVMDGIEATKIIKKELAGTVGDIPVVALTGDFSAKTREECEEVGFDDFHGKPLKRNDLKAVILKFTGFEIK